ncbi:cytochrome P450 [Piedraia hortae CBS 480.64]|uniref:Cytochrome P450 n=1 Tax=Piedraia hortae CBS 480.64 TaxID=1314780 RepID=A0A6A7BUF5_9PEZI|nr:cytochrome P450 [Piedraia hortae CBS 480.64]
MLSLVQLCLAGLVVAYAVNHIRCFVVNLAAAKRSGLPYICVPVYTFNRAWLVVHRLLMPLLYKLPQSWTDPWLQFLTPDVVWNTKYDMFRQRGSDVFLTVTPGGTMMYVADAEVIAQITSRRNDFPKPTWMYGSLNIFGQNVVSTEGAAWRHHRKITSPPFTEKNNHLVWEESLHQAKAMLEGWVGTSGHDSGTVWDVASRAMRLSLHVISRAGFGVRLDWPHENKSKQIPEGHTMSYKDALSTLLERVVMIMLTPKWILAHSPWKAHKEAWEAYVEWGKYMNEIYMAKRYEIQHGESSEGLDLMGALVKGAGISAESASAEVTQKAPTKQVLSKEEVLGNAFAMILAGHETTANTIHFATVFLALHPESQRNLQEDLDRILGDRPISEWTYDHDMPRLFGGMCGGVMNEQLRLIPPVIGIPKCTLEGSPQGIDFNGSHITVPGDCSITINTTATHLNPKYWPHTSEEDLATFRPERWLKSEENRQGTEEEHEKVDLEGPDRRPDTAASLFRPARGAYVPFSMDARSCLGRRFAQSEILAVLAVLFKNYSVELDVSLYMSDAELAIASVEEKKVAWKKAEARARELMRSGMGTVITIQMRKGKVLLRFVRRGEEKFS